MLGGSGWGLADTMFIRGHMCSCLPFWERELCAPPWVLDTVKSGYAEDDLTIKIWVAKRPHIDTFGWPFLRIGRPFTIIITVLLVKVTVKSSSMYVNIFTSYYTVSITGNCINS